MVKPLPAPLILAAVLLLSPAPARPQAPQAKADPAATLGEPAASPIGRALLSMDPKVYERELLWWACDERDGREPGTRGAREAAERAVEQFTRFGCEPMGVKEKGKRTWFQPFPLRRSIAVDPGKATFTLGGKRLVLGEDWALLGGSTSAQLSTRGVASIGYGLSDEDLVRAGAEGKVLVVIEGAPDEPIAWGKGDNSAWIKRMAAKVRRAAEFGAKALVFIPPQGVERPLYLKRQNLVAGRMRIVRTEGGRTRRTWGSVPVIQLSTRAAARFHRPPAATGTPPKVSFSLQYDATRQLYGRNVLACWRGSDPKLAEEYVVIGAHRDHLGVGRYGSRSRRSRGIVHNGADDNATGSVGVMELARALAAGELRPKRSILFMLFDAEEMGLIGSRTWCQKPTVPLEKVVAMINMDMIGRVKVNPASGKGGCTVMGTNTSPAWDKALKAATRHSSLKWMISGGGFGGSDHLPFLQKGIPAVFFNSGLHRDYHTPADDPEKCNPEGAVEILKVLLHTAVHLADLPEKPEFKGTSRGRRVRRGPLLGVIPQQTNKGVLIRSVNGTSPASRAGLRKGDVLVALDGRKISRISDIFRHLRRKRKGQPLKVSWMREGNLMEKVVKL